jgi:hypothetical protein
LQGSTLALRRIGRYGLAFIDGHSDFRHVGNSAGVGAAAGEDVALVTERGQSDLTDLDGLRPICGMWTCRFSASVTTTNVGRSCRH